MTGSPRDVNRLIILAGPSCAGKTPLVKAFRMLYAEKTADLQNIIPYTSRPPRPDEKNGIDYHFVTRRTLDQLVQKHQLVTISVRGDEQGIDLRDIRKGPRLYEGNTFMAQILIAHAGQLQIPRLSIFLSPFHLNELKRLIGKHGWDGARLRVTEIMRGKIERRAARKGYQSEENIDQRAREAFDELMLAGKFNFVIVNPAGEEDEIWDYPAALTGSALQVTKSFAEIIFTGNSGYAQKWPPDFSEFDPD